MRVLFLMAMCGVLGCSRDRLEPVTECGLPCYPDDAPIVDHGQCHHGYWQCDDGQKVCVGYGEPSAETCDGVDNDCNGLVDDLFTTCKTDCGYGYMSCIKGTWTECSARKPSSEICNGIDDDCDGLTDEAQDLPVEFCYDGPAQTVANGACHPGVTRCIGGQKYCANEQTPVPEECNGLDDDCDGQIDEGATGQGKPLDLVFVVDNSGSMSSSLSNLTAATTTWATKYKDRQGLHFALVTAPDKDLGLYGTHPHLYQNFTDAATFSNAMSQQAATGSGEEDTLGAIEQISLPSNPLGLNWTTNSKKVVVVYSDEVPQYVNGTSSKTVDDIVIEANAKPMVVHVFTASYVIQGWADMTQTGGTINDILQSAPDIEQNLDQIINLETCQ
jgi:hypothetical protein